MQLFLKARQLLESSKNFLKNNIASFHIKRDYDHFRGYNVVFLKNGESSFSENNKIAGWVDTPLSVHGRKEAIIAGGILAKHGQHFDLAYTSALGRSQQTMALVCKEIKYVPDMQHHWRLNERHFGAITGMKKKDVLEKFGRHKVMQWRNNFLTAPPPMARRHPHFREIAQNYIGIMEDSELPRSESMRQTIQRVVPLWNKKIAPAVKKGAKVLVVGHDNSLRALLKYIDDGATDSYIAKIHIPSGLPFSYSFDKYMKVDIHNRMNFLGDRNLLSRITMGKPPLPAPYKYERERYVRKHLRLV